MEATLKCKAEKKECDNDELGAMIWQFMDTLMLQALPEMQLSIHKTSKNRTSASFHHSQALIDHVLDSVECAAVTDPRSH